GRDAAWHDATDRSRHGRRPGARRRAGRNARALTNFDWQQLHRRSVLAHGEGRDEDAPRDATLAAPREPGFREHGEALGFATVDRLERRDERARAARLHLDERVARGVEADEVDLADARAHVPRDHAHPATRELALGKVFAGEPEDASIHAR